MAKLDATTRPGLSPANVPTKKTSPADADPQNATGRFTDRVDAYLRGRPGYPNAIATVIAAELNLPTGAVVADLGGGTGLSSRPFLRAGFRVIGVEPNEAMRETGDVQLAHYATYRSIEGRAEATNLPGHSVDLVVAAQAFHWFDIAAARAEAQRILKRPAYAALIWNDRVSTGSPFAKGYEALVQAYGTEYNAIRERHGDEGSVKEFFGHGNYRRFTLPNPTEVDLPTLIARVNSASYMPTASSPSYRGMMERLQLLFNTTQSNGKVNMRYDVRMFFGEIR